MAGLRPLIIGISLVLLFSFCMFTFAIEFINANNPSSDFINNSEVQHNIRNINSTVSDIKDFGDYAQNKMSSSTPLPVEFVFLIFEGAFYIPKAVLSIAVKSVSVFTDMFYLGLAGNSSYAMAFIIFNFAMIITVVFLIIKAIRSGETER